MSEDEVDVTKEFWLQEVVDRLALPLVQTSTFSFEEIKGEFQDA